jgi:protein-S-isoprenylcysteine O-methyltransferase Ste14
MVFWAAPTMTVAHLVFALGMTAYILAAIRWEERDLQTFHPEYAAYRRRVRMLLPVPRHEAAAAVDCVQPGRPAMEPVSTVDG